MNPPIQRQSFSMKLRKWARRAALFAGTTSLAAIIAFRAAVTWAPYPGDAVVLPAASTWIEDRDGNCLGAFASGTGQWCLPLSSDQISPHLFDAIVAIEDRRFYEHHGVDWQSALGAGIEDLLNVRERRGASTITMQLYRLGHPASRSIFAKVQQAVRAEQIEKRLTKREILTDYLNSAPFGGNLVGVGAASWRYFGRPCRDLSLADAALLAGLPQNPNVLRPDRFTTGAKDRRNRVLDDMLAHGIIARQDHDRAISQPVDASWHTLPQETESLGLAAYLADLANSHPGELVRTTLDIRVQRQAADELHAALAELSASHVTAGAAVVLNTQSAQPLARVSLAANSDIDLTQSPRSSGSTLKPFIYAAAFDEGICRPGSILNDSPTAWAGYEPKDYDRDFAGQISAADALALSRNVPAMVLLSKLGINRAVAVMSSMGFKTLARDPRKYGLPLAIGGADVTPMELAVAYAHLANANAPLRPQICRDVLYCLSDDQRTAQVCPSAAALWPAWKTGTSSGHRDAWCAAVTPRFTVVVWLGNADGSGSDALVGQDAAAPVALKILAQCDPGGPGFVAPPGFAADERLASQVIQPSAGNLTIISPANGQEIIPDPSLDRGNQRVALRAANSAGGQLWWFVDGDLVGKSSSEEVLWWTPTLGRHELRVVAANGSADAAEIRVR
jgi:penicillin-binding protein 1C